MRLRRTATAILLAVGVLAAAPTAAVAKRAPEGFHNTSVKKAAFKIALPDEWQVLNLTKGDVDNAFDNLERVAPEVANQFPGGVRQLLAQSVVLYATLPAPNFAPNVNVINQPAIDGLPSLDEVEQGLQSIVPNPRVRDARLDGEDAIRSDYELDLGTVTARGVQYIVVGDKGLLTFTFTVASENPQTKVVKKMIKSIDLT